MGKLGGWGGWEVNHLLFAGDMVLVAEFRRETPKAGDKVWESVIMKKFER